jgi:hypothetical protein
MSQSDDDEGFYPNFNTFVSEKNIANSYTATRSNPNILFDSLCEFNYGKGFSSTVMMNHSNLVRPASSRSLPSDLKHRRELDCPPECDERLRSTDQGLFTITYNGNCAFNNFRHFSTKNSTSCGNIPKLSEQDYGIKCTVLPNGNFKRKRAVLRQPSVVSDNIKSRMSSRENLHHVVSENDLNSMSKLISFKNRSIYLPPVPGSRLQKQGNL